MKNYQNRVLFAKKILPISAGELCKVIGENARLYDVDQDTMITCITFLDRYEPLCEGFLIIGSLARDSYIRRRIAEGGAAALTDHIVEGTPCIVVDSLMSCRFVNDV